MGISQALGNFIFINGSWSPSRTPYIFNYSNNTWSEPLMTNNSGGEQYTHIAYDSKNKKLMSVRQLSNSNQVFIDAYDPISNTWETRSSFDAPNTYGNMDMAYDSESEKIILCYFVNNLFRYSYDYETDSWETLEQGGISLHGYSDMAYDIESDRMIYVRYIGSSTSLQTVSYDYNSDSYESKSSLDFSLSIDDIAVTYDSENDRVILAILKSDYVYFSTYDYNSDTWVLIDTNDTGDGNPVVGGLEHINIAYDTINNIILLTSPKNNNSDLYTYSYDLNTENFSLVNTLDAGSLNGNQDLVFINGISNLEFYSEMNVNDTSFNIVDVDGYM